MIRRTLLFLVILYFVSLIMWVYDIVHTADNANTDITPLLLLPVVWFAMYKVGKQL